MLSWMIKKISRYLPTATAFDINPLGFVDLLFVASSCYFISNFESSYQPAQQITYNDTPVDSTAVALRFNPTFINVASTALTAGLTGIFTQLAFTNFRLSAFFTVSSSLLSHTTTVSAQATQTGVELTIDKIRTALVDHIKAKNIVTAKNNIDKLVALKIDPNKIPHSKATMIGLAINHGADEIVEYLIANGANIHAHDLLLAATMHFSAAKMRWLFEIDPALHPSHVESEIDRIYSNLHIESTQLATTPKESEAALKQKALEVKDVLSEYSYIRAIGPILKNVLLKIKATGKSIYHVINARMARLAPSITQSNISIPSTMNNLLAIQLLISDEEGIIDIIQKGIEPEEADSHGNCLFHYMSGRGKPKIAQMLLDAGVPVNVTNQFGLSPIHISIISENIPLVEFYLNHGAVVDDIQSDELSRLIVNTVANNPRLNQTLQARGIDVNNIFTLAQPLWKRMSNYALKAASEIPSKIYNHFNLIQVATSGVFIFNFGKKVKHNALEKIKNINAFIKSMNDFFNIHIKYLTCIYRNEQIQFIFKDRNHNGLLTCQLNNRPIEIKIADFFAMLSSAFAEPSFIAVNNQNQLALRSDNKTWSNLNAESIKSTIRDFISTEIHNKDDEKAQERYQKRLKKEQNENTKKAAAQKLKEEAARTAQEAAKQKAQEEAAKKLQAAKEAAEQKQAAEEAARKLQEKKEALEQKQAAEEAARQKAEYQSIKDRDNEEREEFLTDLGDAAAKRMDSYVALMMATPVEREGIKAGIKAKKEQEAAARAQQAAEAKRLQQEEKEALAQEQTNGEPLPAMQPADRPSSPVVNEQPLDVEPQEEEEEEMVDPDDPLGMVSFLRL